MVGKSMNVRLRNKSNSDLGIVSLLGALVVFCALAALGACSNPPNTQLLPIGSRCTTDSECGTSPYICETVGYPNGYCDKTCVTTGDCPSDSICYDLHCRRTCVTTADCRQAEGYVCRPPNGAEMPFCDVPEGS